MKQNKLFILLIIMGIIVLIYPFLGRLIHKKNQSYVIQKYVGKIEKMDKEELEHQKQQLENYNKNLEAYRNTNNIIKTGTMLGFLAIPKINLNYPIYEGTMAKVLDKAVGHLEYTGIPTKSYDYHCILVGHTGLTSKKIFDDLEKLKIGDSFKITILNEVFTYNIFEIKKVLPSETKDLKVQKGKQIVTLVTCTPKYVNTHRLLVMGQITQESSSK